jgi:bis(5'-nucleosidyl)-tetraphosphatase
MKKDYAYGVIVFHVDNGTVYYLILKQIQGHWSFPKGHAEDGETALETAKRELEEETGISEVELISNEPQVRDEYIINEKISKPVQKFVEFFIGEVGSKDIVMQEGEIFDHKWITVEQGESLFTYDSSKRLLKSASDLIQNYLQKYNKKI